MSQEQSACCLGEPRAYGHVLVFGDGRLAIDREVALSLYPEFPPPRDVPDAHSSRFGHLCWRRVGEEGAVYGRGLPAREPLCSDLREREVLRGDVLVRCRAVQLQGEYARIAGVGTST